MVFDKVREIIVDQLDVDENDVTMDSLIVEDLGADSLDVDGAFEPLLLLSSNEWALNLG